ncbi:hypothetical protein KBZ07_09300 [Cyanobium sp. BA20m-14]|uniref:beta strand repeat-containing protein n=1 Tax=Cyanobium sp. BA20m-14 TaxID=2823703 RepID=UPI0020CBA8A2|nr:calcium-binding protein [Cyanobium sp. BA20m-14]MCP9913599.1 hypothetical protein [Cyanobium sp. BA20m-14]
MGFDFTQGPFAQDADLETLQLTSNGAITNVVDLLSVGDDLSTLLIDGFASLDITTDLGLLPNGNRRISLIDASFLGTTVAPQDLSLSYTSILGDVVNNSVADVTVLGATGDNLLTLASQAPNNPTDFYVRTKAGNDSVTTGAGEDSIDVAAGNNTVYSFAGNDTVIASAGNDLIVAGIGNDVINAGNGLNSVDGGLGNDSIITGDDNDLIVGDEGVQIGIGSVLGNGGDTIRSGGGADSVFAGSGANLVDSGNGNDWVWLGEIINGTLLGDTFANTVLLGDGNDVLEIDTNSLTVADSINGGAGIDTVRLHNGGTIQTSETLRVSRIEAFDLVGSGDYSITLSDQLVATADKEAGTHIFSVLTSGDAAANVTLDLSYLSPVVLGTSSDLLSIRYSGQADTNTERVIIRDGLISDQTRLAYEEAAADADETFADVMQIVDSADVTKDDLIFVTGLEVIELASSVNGPQTFTFDFRNMTEVEFNNLVGDGNDALIIRATPLLAGAVSQLNVNLTGAFFDTSRIIIEQSADLNVSVVGGTPVIKTALFYTPNPDNLLGTAFSDTFTAYQLSDVQTADNANGFTSNDTLDLRFAVSNSGASLTTQLNKTSISNIEIFRFNPAAVNQAVQFNGIGVVGGLALASIFTSGGADLLTSIERSLFIDTGAGNDSVDIDAAGTVVTGFGNDSVEGSIADDSIVTGEGADTVEAGAGADFVDSGLGNDFVEGDIGDDTINAGEGTNTVSAGLGNDSVVSGSGNDSINTAAGAEELITDSNDTVSSGAGNDTVLVGLGDDSVVAGADNDLIVLGSSFTLSEGIPHTSDQGGFTVLDRIDGGIGIDTLALGLDSVTTSTTTITGIQVQNIEVLNVSPGASNQTLVLATSLLPTGGRLQVNLDGDVNDDGAGFILDGTAFVQGQALDVFTTALNTSSTYNLGAGNDTFTNFAGDASDNVSVAGNGGSDSINLVNGADETVQYNTGNDGGTAGIAATNVFGSVGDFITGYDQANDQILITSALFADIGGALSLNADNSTLLLGTNNVLSLTGPARSVTDAQLYSPNVIAEAINGVGVVGGGGPGEALIVLQGQTQTALYTYIESDYNPTNVGASYTVQANELRQLGVFDNALFTGAELV